MEMEQIQALDESARAKYISLTKLFEHGSYKFLLEWAKSQYLECTARLISATSWEQHCAQFGARAAYESLVNLENSVEAEFSQIADDVLTARIEAIGDTETDSE